MSTPCMPAVGPTGVVRVTARPQRPNASCRPLGTGSARTLFDKTAIFSGRLQGSATFRANPGSRPLSFAVRAQAAEDGEAPRLCQNVLEQIELAADSVKRGLADDCLRQQVTLLLPVNEKEVNFLNTEPTDYPCNVTKEFQTAVSLTKSLLMRVTGQEVEMEERKISTVMDEPCSVVYLPDKSFAAVVFPTSDNLKDIKSLAKVEDRPLLIVNPQWNLTKGQVVSDFGIGPWKKAAEDFLGTFEKSYLLVEQRIGAPGSVNAKTGERFNSGAVLRIQRSYPQKRSVFVMAPDGSNQVLCEVDEEPTYKELEDLVQKGREAKLEIFTVARKVSLEIDQGLPLTGGLEESADAAAEPATEAEDESGPLSATDVEFLDASQLRRELSARGLPTSGKISKLRERLAEAL